MADHVPPPPADPPGQPDVPLGVRAQLLATEHWGLLASRSTTQSEVLTRIAMFLTLTSASLLSLALVGQASDFTGAFTPFAIAVLGVVGFVGVLTQMRVFNAGMEDLMYVLAMNRLRGAYAQLDPGIERYFMASAHDDRAGSLQTYYFFRGRAPGNHVLASSMVFITSVTSAIVGLFAACVLSVFVAGWGLPLVVGVIVGLADFVASAWAGSRLYSRSWTTYRPLFPSPEA
jgi:hypothetical protein